MSSLYAPIWAAARRLGKDRDEVHQDAAQLTGRPIESLTQLSAAELTRLCDGYNAGRRRPSGPVRAGARSPAGAGARSPAGAGARIPSRTRARGGSVKLHASIRQRRYIGHLVRELGWEPDHVRDWLTEKLGTADLDNGVISGPQARDAIKSLLGFQRSRPLWSQR